MTAGKPYCSGEIANKLGKSADWFSEHRAELHAKFAMPQPLPQPGQRRWDRGQIDAWLLGYKRLQAANDAGPMPAAEGAAWQPFLAQVYASRR